jgi:anti-anti-sigma factor
MDHFTAVVDKHGPNQFVVAVAGELDLAHADDLAGELDRLIAPGALIVIDARELTFMDSSGLRALLQAAARAESATATVRLAAPTPAVKLVLDLTGAGVVLDTRADVSGALEAVTAG